MLAQLDGANDDAEEFYRRALEDYRASDDRPGEADCHNILGSLALARADFGRAQTCFERSLEIREESGGVQRKWGATLNNLGIINVLRGDLDSSEEYLHRGNEIAEETDVTFGSHFVFTNLGDVSRLRGNLDRAEAYCNRALEVSTEAGALEGEARALLGLGKIAVERNEPDPADGYVRRALECYEETNTFREQGWAYLWLGKIARERGDLDGCEEFLERALDISQTGEYHYDAAKVRIEQGELAHARNSPEQARTFFTEGIESLTEMGATRDAVEGFERLITHHLLGCPHEEVDESLLIFGIDGEHVNQCYRVSSLPYRRHASLHANR